MKFMTFFASAFLFAFAADAQDRPYFQQEVNYTIEVQLDDVHHMLNGHERFEYVNNSPDVLEFLYIHLWPNAYKNKTTALARQLARDKNFILFYALEDNKGFIDSLDFKVNGQPAAWEYDPQHIDICTLRLPQPLQPGQRITVETPFRVKIPSGSISRLGHIGQSYQITQWYPKPAVYDRNGWHQMPYLTQGEFYSEFGSYDVSINLPANYIVGATGDLQTASEIEFMNQLAEQGLDRPDRLIDNSFPVSSTDRKTIRYVQSNVHDFGWFADKRWLVLKGSVKTPHTGNEVTTWALFTPKNAELWTKAPEYLHDAVYYYSLWNGDYPYKQVTAVDGTISAGGGMEYPNVTVIGNSGSARGLEVVIMHEVGHNWFYGMLGSNERDNAWMDEGINSFNEDRYMRTKYPDDKLSTFIDLGPLNKAAGTNEISYQRLSDLSYQFNASRNLDQPLHCTSDQFTGMNYGAMVYKKTALIFNYLQDYLGEEVFDRCMQTYFDRWKFRHPSPEDIQAVFEEISTQDLDWFFGPLIKTTDKIDYRIRSARKTETGYKVKVCNHGQIEGPIPVSLISEGKVVATVWTSPVAPRKTSVLEVNGSGDQLRIDPNVRIPEVDRSNNFMRTRGLFRKTERVQLATFSGIDNPDRSELYWLPMVGWNEYNNLMAGITLHNRALFQKEVEWSVSPLYSFSRGNLNGLANLQWNTRLITAGLNLRKFNYARFDDEQVTANWEYLRVQPFIRINLSGKPEKMNTAPRQSITLSWQWREHTYRLNYDLADEANRTAIYNYEYATAAYRITWDLTPVHRIETRLQASSNLRLFSNTVNRDAYYHAIVDYSFLYDKKKRRTIDVRLFAGNTDRGGWFLTGQTGEADYLFNDLYFGRTESEGLLSLQLTEGHGMLRTPSQVISTDWLFSGMVDVRLPVRFPIGVYGGASMIAAGGSDEMYATAGISLPLVKDMIEVYIPVISSSNIMDEQDAADLSFAQRITFLLQLDRLNPINIVRSIKP